MASTTKWSGVCSGAALLLAIEVGLALPTVAAAQQDNQTDNVRRIPQPGVPVPAADRMELEAGLKQFSALIDQDITFLRTRPAMQDFLADVMVYHNAVRYALQYDEVFNIREINAAKDALKVGMQRATDLAEGKTPWEKQTGPVVRGYVSKIDGSVQPYGMVVSDSYASAGPAKFRLDFWYHGRGETLSELNFVTDRGRNRGEFTPPNTLVLHPYGRYNCANKFAGEVDTFEALAHAKKHYPIDENRIAVRGFSMGGAACWQFGVHFAGEWAAVAPGAGFSETADFLKVFQKEKVVPTWYEQKLWHMYDCTDYAYNLKNTPTVAYSGEIDSQRQAANMMAAALLKEGIDMVHIIGPKTGHSYEPVAKVEVNRRMDAIMSIGRNPMPLQVYLTTWTLRYNKMRWLTVDSLGKHWDRARVEASIHPDTGVISITSTNVMAFSLDFGPGECPLPIGSIPTVQINGKSVRGGSVASDRSWSIHVTSDGSKWPLAPAGVAGTNLAKVHGLQGPIDDAFMDSFIFVKPTGEALNAKVGDWVTKETDHAIVHWRRHMRGEARVTTDAEITDKMIAEHNLVLFGDPSSNKILARIADKLPIKWTKDGIEVGSKKLDPSNHTLVMCYPNPLNPSKYVVLNNGFTFREYDHLNNARQISKLPDWAVVDINTPINSRWPGKIEDAGFFGEKWEYLAARK
ncbi:MAG: prolyl oligopeptidase family serine peptidase [Chthonomonadales bacterium]